MDPISEALVTAVEAAVRTALSSAFSDNVDQRSSNEAKTAHSSPVLDQLIDNLSASQAVSVSPNTPKTPLNHSSITYSSTPPKSEIHHSNRPPTNCKQQPWYNYMHSSSSSSLRDLNQFKHQLYQKPQYHEQHEDTTVLNGKRKRNTVWETCSGWKRHATNPHPEDKLHSYETNIHTDNFIHQSCSDYSDDYAWGDPRNVLKNNEEAHWNDVELLNHDNRSIVSTNQSIIDHSNNTNNKQSNPNGHFNYLNTNSQSSSRSLMISDYKNVWYRRNRQHWICGYRDVTGAKREKGFNARLMGFESAKRAAEEWRRTHHSPHPPQSNASRPYRSKADRKRVNDHILRQHNNTDDYIYDESNHRSCEGCVPGNLYPQNNTSYRIEGSQAGFKPDDLRKSSNNNISYYHVNNNGYPVDRNTVPQNQTIDPALYGQYYVDYGRSVLPTYPSGNVIDCRNEYVDKNTLVQNYCGTTSAIDYDHYAKYGDKAYEGGQTYYDDMNSGKGYYINEEEKPNNVASCVQSDTEAVKQGYWINP